MQVGRTRPAAPKPVARKRAARTRRRGDGLMRAVGVMGREEAQLKNLARSISADAAHEKTRAVTLPAAFELIPYESRFNF